MAVVGPGGNDAAAHPAGPGDNDAAAHPAGPEGNDAAAQQAKDAQKKIKDAQKKRRRKIAQGVAVLCGLVFGLMAYVSYPDIKAQLFSHALPPPSCPLGSDPSGEPHSISSEGTVTAKLQPGQPEAVNFGRSFTSRSITEYLSLNTVPRGSAYFHIRMNPFLRADDASLRCNDIVASAVRDGGTLILNVLFNRGKRSMNLGDPGSYSGSVTIDDSRLKTPVTVPIIVTMQYTNGVFLLWLYAFAVIPGAWCVWVLRSQRDGNDDALSLEFMEWAISVKGLVALVAGSVAAFAVYVGVYLRDPTWGSSALQPLTLYGGMFSAFVTTSGLASLTSQKRSAS